MRNLSLFLLGIMPLFFTACNNDDIETPEDKLSVEVAQDLDARFEGAVIKSVNNWEHDWVPGTEVNLVDKNGNDVHIFYQNFKDLARTVTDYARFENLPGQVREGFYRSSYGTLSIDQIEHIVCEEYAQLPKKMYKFQFHQSVSGIGNLYTMLTFNEDGYMLPVRHEGNIHEALLQPLPSSDEINFIYSNYGGNIRSYVYDSYQVFDHDVLKNVQFRDGKWIQTRYHLPLDTAIPSDVLEELNKQESDFVYTQLYRLETPDRNGYEFLNEEGNGYIIFSL